MRSWKRASGLGGPRRDTACLLRTLLLNVEPLTGVRPLGHGLAEHGHEILVVILGPARELAQIVGRAELYRGLLGVPNDLYWVARYCLVCRIRVSLFLFLSFPPSLSLSPMASHDLDTLSQRRGCLRGRVSHIRSSADAGDKVSLLP